MPRTTDDLDRPGWKVNPRDPHGRAQLGVNFSEETLAEAPLEPLPYSKLSELESLRIDAMGWLRSCNEAIERYQRDPVALATEKGRGPADVDTEKWYRDKLAAVLEEENRSLEDGTQEMWELDIRIAHMKKGAPFDFTWETFTTDPDLHRDLTWEAETFKTQVECERLFQTEPDRFPEVTAARLREALRIDKLILETGDEQIPVGAGFHSEEVDGVARGSILAMVDEAARRNPPWWRRCKDLGPTPEIVKEAQEILKSTRHRRPSSDRSRYRRRHHRRPLRAARSRCSRVNGRRRRQGGSRRSISASRDDGGGGGPGGSDLPALSRASLQTTLSAAR